jgi:hypothetical protein
MGLGFSCLLAQQGAKHLEQSCCVLHTGVPYVLLLVVVQLLTLVSLSLSCAWCTQYGMAAAA